jgi:GPH family glycoside/pentoside/hexuronide:cation symporter
MALIFVLTFYVPDVSERWRLIYAYATFFSLGLIYSFVNIAYSALLPMMTTNLNEKLKLGSARSVGTSLGVILVTALFMPAVQYFGKGDEKLGFFITASILAVLCMALLFITYANCKERYAVQAENQRPVTQSLKFLVNNSAWLAVSGFATLNFVRFGAVLALTPYFAIHVLQAPWMISILLPALSGTLLFGAFIAPPLLRKFGLKKGNFLALVVSVLFYLILPLVQQYQWLFIACYLVVSLVLSLTMISIFTMASEAVDYHEQQFGVRDEGLLSAGVGFAIKVGMALGSAAVAYGLAYGGYQAGAVTDTAKAVMTYMYFGLPVVVFVLQLFCLRYYPTR